MALRNRQAVLFLPMRVWDLPTRLFHWLLVLLIPASYVTAKLNKMDLHMALGHAMLALLLFRWMWGVVGSDTAKFAGFLASPLAAFRHLARIGKREPDMEVGHNAAGGWMVLAMLVLLSAHVGAGLCASDGGGSEGPLAKYVGNAWSNRLSQMHEITFKLILVAIAVHVLAISAYAVLKRQNLVRPMISGKKRLPAATPAPRQVGPVMAIAILVAAAAVALVVSRL
jgi:cytochrome b